jgi:ABC-type dipeptide/oligopeptide/nickel transport system permease component
MKNDFCKLQRIAQVTCLLGLTAAAAFAQSGDISPAFATGVRLARILIAIFAVIGMIAGALLSFRRGRYQDRSRERLITGGAVFVVSLVAFVVCLVRLIVLT